jgi:RNA polymerase sigma-70 factor (ECF subfamily)
MTALALDWQALLKEHDRWLRTVIAARVPEPEGIDEVLQEVAMAAVKQAAPLNDPSKAAPWLYRLAVRQSLLYRRKRGRQRKLLDRYTQRSGPDAGVTQGNALNWLLARERQDQVRKALDRLSPRDAQILLLKYGENWNYHQIAEHLGVSHSAIETRLHRARARLREELSRLDIGEADV